MVKKVTIASVAAGFSLGALALGSLTAQAVTPPNANDNTDAVVYTVLTQDTVAKGRNTTISGVAQDNDTWKQVSSPACGVEFLAHANSALKTTVGDNASVPTKWEQATSLSYLSSSVSSDTLDRGAYDLNIGLTTANTSADCSNPYAIQTQSLRVLDPSVAGEVPSQAVATGKKVSDGVAFKGIFDGYATSTPFVGATLKHATDKGFKVKVSNTYVARVYGPLAPVNGSCANLNFNTAPLAQTFDPVAVDSNTTKNGLGEFTANNPGCYSYAGTLSTSFKVDKAASIASLDGLVPGMDGQGIWNATLTSWGLDPGTASAATVTNNLWRNSQVQTLTGDRWSTNELRSLVGDVYDDIYTSQPAGLRAQTVLVADAKTVTEIKNGGGDELSIVTPGKPTKGKPATPGKGSTKTPTATVGVKTPGKAVATTTPGTANSVSNTPTATGNLAPAATPEEVAAAQAEAAENNGVLAKTGGNPLTLLLALMGGLGVALGGVVIGLRRRV